MPCGTRALLNGSGHSCGPLPLGLRLQGRLAWKNGAVRGLGSAQGARVSGP